MPMLRYSNNWVILYILLLYLCYRKLKLTTWLWLLFAIITITLSDVISSAVVKNIYNTLRPCQDNSLLIPVRMLLPRCPSSGGFTSSHATNHFAISIFFSSTLCAYYKYTKWLYVWAACICYAQVYVGVHYPGDVLGGMLLGLSIGYITATVYQYIFTTFRLHPV